LQKKYLNLFVPYTILCWTLGHQVSRAYGLLEPYSLEKFPI